MLLIGALHSQREHFESPRECGSGWLPRGLGAVFFSASLFAVSFRSLEVQSSI